MSDEDASIDDCLLGKPIDKSKKRERIMKKINEHYLAQNASRVVPVDAKNIVIIGRSRTGKSTIKSMLVDPTQSPTELSLKSGTREPSMESYFIDGENLMLNIIDTPGLFESHSEKDVIRDNDTIMKAIETCINMEITKFHLICFAFSIPAGIQSDDVEALKLFIKLLGPELSKNSCLIITRAESKTESQRTKLLEELLKDVEFKKISTYFARGIFFTGSINYDDFDAGNSSIIGQYKAVLGYRTALLDVFAKECTPFQIKQSYISEIRRVREQYDNQIKLLESDLVKVQQKEEIQREYAKAQKAADDERKRIAATSNGCSIS